MTGKRRILFFLLVLSMALIIAISFTRSFGGKYEEQADIMGTMFTVKIDGPGSNARSAKAAFDEIRRLDRLLSTYKDDSEISAVNRLASKEPVAVGPDFLNVAAASREYYKLSEGAFDPAVYPLIQLWRSAKRAGRLPSAEQLAATADLVGLDKVLIDESAHTVSFSQDGMALDFGGIGKGYAVDRAVQALKEEGVRNAIVDAGGNFYAFGKPREREQWRAGIRHPLRTDEVIARFPVTDKGVATSGNYERFFQIGGRRYCHIFDPRTGRPVEGILSTTIIAGTATEADALSTAVFVLGREKGMRLIEQTPDVEGIIITYEDESPGNFKIVVSSGLKDNIELLIPAAS